mmetsp:Transcript_7990/g.20020  ORF Transcript_7990/g.20020 Transcript_7990/m.20020 type:complete len:228 (-) Transcript_7990:408-1091(-)
MICAINCGVSSSDRPSSSSSSSSSLSPLLTVANMSLSSSFVSSWISSTIATGNGIVLTTSLTRNRNPPRPRIVSGGTGDDAETESSSSPSSSVGFLFLLLRLWTKISVVQPMAPTNVSEFVSFQIKFPYMGLLASFINMGGSILATGPLLLLPLSFSLSSSSRSKSTSLSVISATSFLSISSPSSLDDVKSWSANQFSFDAISIASSTSNLYKGRSICIPYKNGVES